MSVADAAFNTAHEYPYGGAEALGQRMGKSNLSAEVNPNNTNAKLGLLDAVRLQVFARDYRILYAMAAECGHYPPLPMPEGASADAPCLRQVSALAGEFAETMQVVTASLGDNRITDNELQAARRAWQALIVCGQGLMQSLEAMNAELHTAGPGVGR
jgi:hypothetical protein